MEMMGGGSADVVFLPLFFVLFDVDKVDEEEAEEEESDCGFFGGEKVEGDGCGEVDASVEDELEAVCVEWVLMLAVLAVVEFLDDI
jgi:hypothetical protein